ncbi:MAG: hypothetical protein IJA41_00015 [Clostridia bacterium]|nr:hypothetical protein [Clostridia bacterium]
MSLFEKKIYNVKNEIDYDKLADAIVSAQERKEQKDREAFSKAKVKGLSKLLAIVLIIAAIVMFVGGVDLIISKSYMNGFKAIMCAAVFIVLNRILCIMAKTRKVDIILNLTSIVLAMVSVAISVFD